MGEVNYFASKIHIENNIEAPTVVIPSIGVNEKINTESLNQGVLQDPAGVTPGDGAIVLYGHRTLQGSPFLRLNELKSGDTILLEWPGVGEIKYTVSDSYIVPASYSAEFSGNKVFLITCDPIGSTENRLIIEGDMVEQNPINEEIIKDNPQESNAFLISAAFLILGLILTFIYPRDNRAYIFITVILVSALLFFFCFSPIPSELIYDKIIFLNGGL